MRIENATVDGYLREEFKFWKSLRRVYLRERHPDTVLDPVFERTNHERVLARAERRFNSLALLMNLFESRHMATITKRVNKRMDADLEPDDLRNLDRLKKKANPPEGASELAMLFGWVEIVTVIVAAAIVAIIYASEEDDDVSITHVGPIKQNLIAEGARLTCAEIGELDYAAWLTYYVLMGSKGDSSNQILTLTCGSCANLSVLAEAHGYDYSGLLPEDTTWLGAFLFGAKLDECGLLV